MTRWRSCVHSSVNISTLGRHNFRAGPHGGLGEIGDGGNALMPLQRDRQLSGRGTRFKVFPQPRFLEGFETPEVVWVSPPAGTIGPGPSDDRMAVIDAIDKKPYDDTLWPPYSGVSRPGPIPDANGHFDYLDEDSREFGAAHLYAVTRRVLDIWEGYFGKRIPWYFEDIQDRLELIPYVEWNNAHAGYGFLETGFGKARSGERHPYCLNFDVLAHETGHIIVFSVVGIPHDNTLTAEYKAYHESSSDMVALLSLLHFESFVDRLLNGSSGNLCAENELNRIAELSDSEEIRKASHGKRMRDVANVSIPWNRLNQKQLHAIGEPMTGAMFDILVEMFQELLVERSLITRSLADMAFRVPGDAKAAAEVQAGFDAAYRENEACFKEALIDARDMVGERLARTWEAIGPHHLSFANVAVKFLSADRALTGSRYQEIVKESFLWREIGFGFTR